ncbi:polysaccharide deacetylase family protein [Sediminitomix flava]|uniref:Polysaccharide deacetylase n=1 Tax=Sediminitomix flava TaxID=379075 RepID=A0A315Z7C2_SEDFL|nr:polysaccharide deacetylase family protein [Sediminitomix flava]PWJ40747.1 polysaccharide deacetylase [Sediminitomix flava]
MKNFLIFFLTIISLSSSCHKVEKKAGIWLSFDDQSIDQWYDLKTLLDSNSVKATFFISYPHYLTPQKIQKLKNLEKDGHEIGFHGYHHELSEYYIKEHGYLDYIEKEINQGLKIMQSHGFQCTSFAYPFGAKYWFTDFILSQKFEFTRGVTSLNQEKDLSKMEDIYYKFDNDRSLSAISFDNNSGVSLQMLDIALQRALTQNEVLMLYAHKPTNTDQKSYTFNTTTLKYIIDKANTYQLMFYTTKDFDK